MTLARAAPPTWREYVAHTVGDPDTDGDFLRQRSPVTHVDQITASLFVIQGAQDPRVPQAESDQIVELLRGKGIDVRYDIYPDECHGFTHRANDLHAHADIVNFLVGHLLPDQDSPT